MRLVSSTTTKIILQTNERELLLLVIRFENDVKRYTHIIINVVFSFRQISVQEKQAPTRENICRWCVLCGSAAANTISRPNQMDFQTLYYTLIEAMNYLCAFPSLHNPIIII